jgi:hypothetical protein
MEPGPRVKGRDGRQCWQSKEEEGVKKSSWLPGSIRAHRGIKREASQVSWCMPVIPVLGKLRQEDGELEASLDYT